MPSGTISTPTTITTGPCDTVHIKNRLGSPADLTIVVNGMTGPDILEAGDNGYYRFGVNSTKIIVMSSSGSATFIWAEVARGPG